MPAPGQHVETEFRRVGQLDEKDLVGRDGPDRVGRERRRQRMKAVQNDPDRWVVGTPYDFPGIAIVVDVASPGQRLETDAQAARSGKFAKRAEIGRRAIDAAER